MKTFFSWIAVINLISFFGPAVMADTKSQINPAMIHLQQKMKPEIKIKTLISYLDLKSQDRKDANSYVTVNKLSERKIKAPFLSDDGSVKFRDLKLELRVGAKGEIFYEGRQLQLAKNQNFKEKIVSIQKFLIGEKRVSAMNFIIPAAKAELSERDRKMLMAIAIFSAEDELEKQEKTELAKVNRLKRCLNDTATNVIPQLDIVNGCNEQEIADLVTENKFLIDLKCSLDKKTISATYKNEDDGQTSYFYNLDWVSNVNDPEASHQTINMSVKKTYIQGKNDTTTCNGNYSFVSGTAPAPTDYETMDCMGDVPRPEVVCCQMSDSCAKLVNIEAKKNRIYDARENLKTDGKAKLIE